MCATTIQAFAPPMEEFSNGREFAVRCGLVPRQKSTGGRQILARTSKMGQRDIQQLLITGTMAVIRWAIRKGPPHLDHGLQRCRPTSLVCVWRLHWQTSLPVLFGR